MSFVDTQKRVELLRRKRILYAVVDPAQISSRHHLLFRKVFDLTFVLAQRLATIVCGDVKYFDTIDEAMSQGRFYDLVIAQSVGNFIIDYRFLEALDEFCRSNSDFFLLIFPPTPQVDGRGGPEFDGRMMVVNVDAWERLGYPGLDEKLALTENLTSCVRPYSTVRESFAPLPTCGLQKTLPTMRLGRGREFLDAAMARGLTVDNFPESLRSYSLYIWPEFESSRLYEGLVNRDESSVSNAEQKRWICLSNSRSTVWIYNSERYRFNIPLRHCDAYFGPAAGFKYLDILSYNPNVEFFFYDQNEESLEWIKALKCNWDGNDFVRYVNRQPEALRAKFKYVNSSIDQDQKLLLDGFGGEENFKRLWTLFKSANAKFVKCDLFSLSDVCELIYSAKAMKPFFYYSNIFSTIFTLATFSREEAEERYGRFKSAVKTRFPDVIMHGADVAGRWH